MWHCIDFFRILKYTRKPFCNGVQMGSVQFDSDMSARALYRDKITKLNFAKDSFDSNHDFDLWFLIRVKHEYLQRCTTVGIFRTLPQ